MRYLQRDLGESIINDRTYETWKKTNTNSEDLIKIAAANINKQKRHIVTGKRYKIGRAHV